MIQIFVSLCLIFLHPVSTEALKCYHCAFVQGSLPNPGQFKSDPTCKPGGKSNPSLSVDCKDLEYIPDHDGKENVINRFNGENSTGNRSDGKWEFSCFTLTFNGKIKTDSDIDFTLRSCLARAADPGSGSRLPEKCYSDSTSEIGKQIKEDEVKGLLDALRPLFTNDTQAGVCTCNADNCNGFKAIPGRKAEIEQEANYANIQQKISSLFVLALIFPFIFILLTCNQDE